MAVPGQIREVPRPKNTIVVDNGKEGSHRYAVRERIGVRYVPGGNPQPQNGKVVGYIYEGRFVPKDQHAASVLPDMLSYGSAALVRSVTKDLLSELMNVYEVGDACTIMAIASLRIIKPEITSSRLSTHYSRTFVSRYYPGIALSPNTVSKFLKGLGQAGIKRRAFYQRRAASVISEHHIAIDGMLKQDTSSVNDLSAFSYKSRIKGGKEVSVLYAYDIDAMEPICAEVFPGNSIDASSYVSFIRNNDIRKGIIVADKGFPPSKIADELQQRPDLHFLTPIKRNDVRIANNNMLSYEGILKGLGEKILYKKSSIKGGRFLYAFKDTRKAAIEEGDFISRATKNNDFELDKYTKKREFFGVIVFESDQDLPPEIIYQCYDDRWQLELVFRHYKSDECLDKTNVQGDFSVIGSEFINFIATVATCRILKKARVAGLLEKMSYGELMEDLSSAWRRSDAPEDAKSNDGYWVHTLNVVFEELEALGLSAPAFESQPKKRGRKPKNATVNKPKRPRGRPRKNPQ